MDLIFLPMKTVLLLIIFPILTAQGQHEDSLNTHKNESGWLGFQADYTGFPSKKLSGIGIGMEYQLTKHFGVGYSFLIGRTDSSDRYLYCGGGQAAFLYFVNNFKPDKAGTYLMLIALALPESYQLYLPISESMRIAFFLSPYGFDFEKHRLTEKESYHISLEFGTRFQWLPAPWFQIAPQIGFKKFYDSKDNALSAGISCFFRAVK